MRTLNKIKYKNKINCIRNESGLLYYKIYFVYIYIYMYSSNFSSLLSPKMKF